MCRLPVAAAVDPGHETKWLLNGGRGLPKKKDLARKLLNLQKQIQTPPATSSPTPTPSPNPTVYGPPPSRPHHNLPALEASRFIGYDRQLIQLLKLLGDSHPTHRLGIQGIGGIGKTTLVLEAAYRCLLQEQFEAIVFTCAQRQRLVGDRLLRRVKRDRHLGDIFHTIARVLQYPHILAADFEIQFERIQDLLSHRQVLLIVDHLEGFDDPDEICEFLYELPSTVKAVVTTRQYTALDVTIALDSLSPQNAQALIAHELQEKGVSLNTKDQQQFYEKTGGIPGAILYRIGQLAGGYTLNDVLAPPNLETSDDLTRYCFESSVMPLRGTAVHRLFMAAAIFPKPMLAIALYTVAAVTQTDELANLQRLSLLTQTANGRYAMLPLTRRYALAELKQNPEFEQDVRQRWLAWYRQFVETHCPQDGRQWHHPSELEAEWETLLKVVDWCMDCDRYQDVLYFWRFLHTDDENHDGERDRLPTLISPLDWDAWLIENAQMRQDWSVALEVMQQKGWKLMIDGKPNGLDDAKHWFQEADEFPDYWRPKTKLNLTIFMAHLRIKQKSFDEALQWLTQGKSIFTNELNLSQNTDSPKPEPLEIKQYQARLLYTEGKIHYNLKNPQASKNCLKKALTLAQSLDLEQTEFLSKESLAQVAIEEENYEEAEFLLSDCLEIAKDNQDTYRIAFYLRAIAEVELTRDNPCQALALVREALEQFKNLGLVVEQQDTQVLLEVIEFPKITS